MILIKYQSTLVGLTEVEWEIKDWGGPHGSLIRSQAYCFVTVGDVELRFHLRPFSNMEYPIMKYCPKENHFYARSGTGCDNCAKCTTSSNTLCDIPGVTLPPNDVRCSGYSLLVDVLSAQKQALAFWVETSGMAPSYYYNPRNNSVVIKSGEPNKDVVAIPNFYRTAYWAVDKEGNVTNYTGVTTGDKTDFKCLLSVTLYEIDCKGTDGNWTSGEEPSDLVKEFGSLKVTGEIINNVALTSKDGMSIHVSPVILTLRSAFFKRCFAKKTLPISGFYVNFNSHVILELVRYMTTDKISSDSVSWLEEMYEAAKELELIGFLNSLDQTMGSWCRPSNVYLLQGAAERYKLSKAKADVDKFISRNIIESYE